MIASLSVVSPSIYAYLYTLANHTNSTMQILTRSKHICQMLISMMVAYTGEGTLQNISCGHTLVA